MWIPLSWDTRESNNTHRKHLQLAPWSFDDRLGYVVIQRQAFVGSICWKNIHMCMHMCSTKESLYLGMFICISHIYIYIYIYIYHSLEISETTKMSSMYYESIINVFTVYAPWISEKKLLAGCDRRGIRMIRPFDSSFLFVSEGWAEFGLLCRDFKTKEYCHLLTPQLWSPFVCEQSVRAIYVPSSH